MPWDPPGVVDDLTIARLPFPTAQRLLAGTILRGSTVRTVTEWHANGPDSDPELGSFCMVRAGGPLEDLVGERLRIRYGARSVLAYCHRAFDLDDDMSLHRTLFVRLARLDTTNLQVLVDVVG